MSSKGRQAHSYGECPPRAAASFGWDSNDPRRGADGCVAALHQYSLCSFSTPVRGVYETMQIVIDAKHGRVAFVGQRRCRDIQLHGFLLLNPETLDYASVSHEPLSSPRLVTRLKLTVHEIIPGIVAPECRFTREKIIPPAVGSWRINQISDMARCRG